MHASHLMPSNTSNLVANDLLENVFLTFLAKEGVRVYWTDFGMHVIVFVNHCNDRYRVISEDCWSNESMWGVYIQFICTFKFACNLKRPNANKMPCHALFATEHNSKKMGWMLTKILHQITIFCAWHPFQIAFHQPLTKKCSVCFAIWYD